MNYREKYQQRLKSISTPSASVFINGLIAVAILFIIYQVWNKFFGKSESEQSASNMYKNSKEPNMSVATLTASQAESIANDIYGNINLLNFDWTELYTAFGKIQNPDDMRAVYKAFGVREFHTYPWIFTTEKWDLITACTNRMTSEAIAPIENKLSWI